MVGEWVNGLLEGAVLEKLESGGKVNIIVSIASIVGIVSIVSIVSIISMVSNISIISIVSYCRNYAVLEKLACD